MPNNDIKLLECFMRISHLLHQQHQNLDKHCGGTCRGQGRVLALLKAQPHVSQKELATLLNIRSQSLGELLVRLEKSGCILRTASPKDQRAMDITLTPHGMQAAEQVEAHRRNSAKIFDCLDAEEKQQLSHILQKLTAELDTQSDEAAEQ